MHGSARLAGEPPYTRLYMCLEASMILEVLMILPRDSLVVSILMIATSILWGTLSGLGDKAAP